MSKLGMAHAAKAQGPHSVLDQIGDTPLIRLEKLSARFPGVERISPLAPGPV